jgi:signal transduction histidine kinase
MMNWGLDFYGELSTICIALQVGPDSGERDTWEDFTHRYSEWSHAGLNQDSVETIYSNPDLIENIYIWVTSQRSNPRLLRLAADTDTIENSNAPPNLRTLLTRLQANSANLPLALNAWALHDSSGKRLAANDDPLSSLNLPESNALHLLRSNGETGWQFDASIPAIVHPIIHHAHQHSAFRHQPTSQSPVDWIVVVLQPDTIQKRILPELAKRYFEQGEGRQYEVAVIATGQTPRLFYSSDLGFGSRDIDAADSTMNIFAPPPESAEGRRWRSVGSGASGPSTEWHRFSSPVWFPVIEYTSYQDPWVLVVKHRNGPIETIVANISARNLMIGGVVLLLLAASMGLVVIASQRAQRLAKLQLDFVTSVSHELLTPVAAIFSTGQNIRDGLIEGRSDLLLHGSIITTQARQLKDLVDQILLFASTESQNRYILRPLQVSEVLQCVSKNVAVLVDEGGFVFEQHVEADLPYVMGDLSALSHCLTNLIANAIKYSGQSRWVGVSAGVGRGENRPKEVWISVQDHGMGISNSDLPHIFEPFYRSSKVMDAQIHGTGLGLAVAKRIAEALGGKLSVTSEIDVGSIFTLHLPIAREWCPETPFVPSEADLGIQK